MSIEEFENLAKELVELSEDERKCLNNYAREEGYSFRLYAYMPEIQANDQTEQKLKTLLAKISTIRKDKSYKDLNAFLYARDKTIEGGFVPPITSVLEEFE